MGVWHTFSLPKIDELLWPQFIRKPLVRLVLTNPTRNGTGCALSHVALVSVRGHAFIAVLACRRWVGAHRGCFVSLAP